MKKRTFISSLLAVPALVFLPKAKAVTEKKLSKHIPLPNTEEFNIEVFTYRYDGHFMYFCPSREHCRQWLMSFCTPFECGIDNQPPDDFNGYSIHKDIADPSFWQPPWPNCCHPLNDCWGFLYIRLHERVEAGSQIIKKITRIEVKTGFTDTAPPVYNDTIASRKWFWDTTKSSYTPYIS